MGLFIAAAITTALALAGFAILLRHGDDRRAMTLAFLVALPLSPLMIYAGAAADRRLAAHQLRHFGRLW